MAPAAFDSELGAFVDEICADLCRFECAAATGCAPADVGVEREVTLAPEIHADLRVEPPGGEPFFVVAVLNAGGMLYQFVGDEVVGVFGLHQPPATAVLQALACARSLCEVGNAVSSAWQRTLDRVQPSRGVHIGIGMGEVGMLPWRPFSRTHLGFIGEPLNLAARLMGEARSSEIVVTNTFYTRLDAARRAHFEPVPPIEAKNVGVIQGWRTTQQALEAFRGRA